MTPTFDAVVIGSGVNGLVAAAQLARGGWSVALIEGSDRLGGFIATEERTLPGYLHDTYSSWHPLFVSGGAYAALGADLHRHGLEYRNTDGLITGTVTDEGRVVLAHRDPAATAEMFGHSEDRTAYLTLLQRFLDNADALGGILGGEPRSPRVRRHVGGSAELDQALLWRPYRARPGTPHLYPACGTSAPRPTPARASAPGRGTS
ncbi:FAD-dependent oxidoreductase [Streptomyces sp. NBC_01707]|jgi:phytoene dehydrogenase-like protein|uniref:phytoene desaturase family protein n=1 Tax=unclassified Streptomyces TaxID=2593676 RepID=UPI0008F2E1A4|nr:FAD-dependent oxidoreductase [Streptomyces sp. ok210]SFT27713.1 NAD(P)-binding Rossmann-like domain-containing protein [Streptomyces sp. ok210]